MRNTALNNLKLSLERLWRINILIYAQSLAEAQPKISTAGNTPKLLLVARLPKI